MQKIELLRLSAVKKSRDNNAMHAKSGLRVFLKWKVYRPDSVIAAVMRLRWFTYCVRGRSAMLEQLDL